MIGPVDLRHVSIANLTVGGGDPIALIEAAGEAGFGAVGLLLRSAMAKPVSHEIIGKPAYIREIREAAAASGVRIFDVEAFVLRPGAKPAEFRPALETGAMLGATHISVIGTERIGNAAFLSEAERIDLLGRLCDEAAGFGLHIGVEFMRYRDIATLQDALALIERTGRGGLGVILDALHFHRTGGKAAELAALPAARIAYVQLCDAGSGEPPLAALATEARTGRLHPGEGVIPLGAMLDALPSDAHLVVEAPIAVEADWTLKRKVASAAEHFRRFFREREASGQVSSAGPR